MTMAHRGTVLCSSVNKSTVFSEAERQAFRVGRPFAECLGDQDTKMLSTNDRITLESRLFGHLRQ
jgi:hypothetical protein